MQICPSILEPTSESLFTTINRLSPFYKYFQIDIADGIYVPNKTVQIDEIISTIGNWQLAIDNCFFDFHLMVKDYETEIMKLEKLKNLIKINNILIHFSAITNFQLPINNLSALPIGLTLNPEDQVADLAKRYNLNHIPFVQIMSVVPGVQGNPFVHESLNKIEQLRLLGYKSKIFLDGAINDKTLPIINKLKYKPDVICPGSFLAKAKDLKVNVEYLENYKS